ncbi:hypothetical protein [Campylobacter gastrosuis]|uniref:Uncharacterized protein n=1 Tax=Campylobacter gastrosuis TaxID=2974576 RepID=A0ABT7HU82_9BACT|nr:hypothetical protein [Campylobacter gastrosuis]MDL0090008.1 hypothetical protein [Campylobacter gastrosuis]
MKKEITLTIASRDYVITIDDEEFARVLERDLGGFVGDKKFLSPKELLDAFVQKCYDSYSDECVLRDISKDIDRILKVKR